MFCCFSLMSVVEIHKEKCTVDAAAAAATTTTTTTTTTTSTIIMCSNCYSVVLG